LSGLQDRRVLSCRRAFKSRWRGWFQSKKYNWFIPHECVQGWIYIMSMCGYSYTWIFL